MTIATLARAGLRELDKPIGSYLSEPTGVGKTEVARQLADEIQFGKL